MTSRLTNTEPASVAKRALDTYRDLLAKGHTDGYSRAFAIGAVVVEAEDVKNRECVDFAPPGRDERDWERGGFARQGREPGRAGWEEEI